MSRFLKKLFGRNKSSSEETTGLTKKKKLSRKEKKALKKEKKSNESGAFDKSILSPKAINIQVKKNENVPSSNHQHEGIIRKPAFNPASPQDAHKVLQARKENVNGLSSKSSNFNSNSNMNSNSHGMGMGDFDNDAFNTGFANFGEEDRENQPVSLSYNHLQQFEKMQGAQPDRMLHPFEDPNKPQFSRLVDGQLAMTENPGVSSPATSSDFCFSTDQEDAEYNQMRQKSRLDQLMDAKDKRQSQAPFNPAAISSYMDRESDGEDSSDDALPVNRSRHYISECEDEEPPKPKAKTEINAEVDRNSSHKFTFDHPALLSPDSPKQQQQNKQKKQNQPSQAAPPSPAEDKPKSPLNVSSVEIKPRKTPDPPSARDAFPDSSDSEPEDPPTQTQKESKPKTVIENFGDLQKMNPSGPKVAKSVTGPSSPLSDLILQNAKENHQNRINQNNLNKSNVSVKSAPNGNVAYLRQQHQLGKLREALDLDRMPSSITGRNSKEENNSVASAKENFRRRRKKRLEENNTSTSSVNKEKRRSQRRHKRSSDESDDSDENDNDWLFDEVTGALGPRGIAADLESLGGNSYRSHGGKSTRSHRSHRSHRSQKSQRSRRHKSSNDSIDSRHSRQSHYSRRSNRSSLSQMSEQSRSVANDLLRLEMQLAMKGGKSMRDESSQKHDDRSIGSRSSRNSHSRSVASKRTNMSSRARRRAKINLTAPPGKLGIILANRNDSRGTVVSGVRTTSVLAGKISPGDRIVAIDGEDVSRITVSEITTIMARKSEFDRQLTVLLAPKRNFDDNHSVNSNNSRSRRSPSPNPLRSSNGLAVVLNNRR